MSAFKNGSDPLELIAHLKIAKEQAEARVGELEQLLKSHPNPYFAHHVAEVLNTFDGKVYRDGNQKCATRHDFINLQESNAGFGDTEAAAIDDLIKTELHDAAITIEDALKAHKAKEDSQ